MIVLRENRFVFFVLLAIFNLAISEKLESPSTVPPQPSPSNVSVSHSAVGVPLLRDESGAIVAVPVLLSGNSTGNLTLTPVVLTGNLTAHAANSTEEHPEEPTVTEKIRSYIEDSVTTVKTAISKIGHFIGDLFDDKKNSAGAHNGTATNNTLNGTSSQNISLVVQTPSPAVVPLKLNTTSPVVPAVHVSADTAKAAPAKAAPTAPAPASASAPVAPAKGTPAAPPAAKPVSAHV